MNACTLRLLCLVWLTGCVLPDYEVGSASEQGASKEPKDAAAADGSTQRSGKALLPGADDACEHCVMDNCQEQRSACGSDCADYKWPVSPAWKVSTDHANDYVKCLAMQCEDNCQVSWGCNGKYSFDEPSESTFPLTVRVTDAVRSTYEIAGVRVTACQGLDPSCSNGVGLVGSGVTNAMGRVQLSLPRAFDGYFLVEVEKEQPDGAKYVPMTVKWSEQVFRVESELTVSLFEPELIAALGNKVEMTEAGKGNFIFKAQNCLPEPFVGEQGANASAADVVVSYTALGNGSMVYYVGGGFAISLDLMATSTAGGGFGGVFNVTPGPVSVNGVHEGSSVSGGSFPLRAETLGAIFMLPKAKR